MEGGGLVVGRDVEITFDLQADLGDQAATSVG
jgi:hypothetical protein